MIVVNDNGRSYTPTVGGIATHLSSLRTDRRYEQALDKDLPTHLAGVISQHLSRLKSDRDRVAALSKASA